MSQLNSDNHHSKLNQLDLSDVLSVDSLAKQLSSTGVFGGGRLGKAIDILESAETNGAKIFVGLAGAMVPGGMRNVVSQAIMDDRINCLITTGANITHDLIEAFGGNHLKGVHYESDTELRQKGIDRVYDSFVADGAFELFEEKIRVILQKIWEEKSRNDYLHISPSELINKFGEYLNDQHSIVKTAYDKKIPIFVPAISDSILGMQIWLFSQFNKIIIDPIKDLGNIQQQFNETKSACAFLLGGGVPKNYTLQAALIATKHYDYAVQITMDRVETGGLSGASLSEAVSWGKIEPEAKSVTVISDITIALPIIYSALKQRKMNREEKI